MTEKKPAEPEDTNPANHASYTRFMNKALSSRVPITDPLAKRGFPFTITKDYGDYLRRVKSSYSTIFIPVSNEVLNTRPMMIGYEINHSAGESYLKDIKNRPEPRKSGNLWSITLMDAMDICDYRWAEQKNNRANTENSTPSTLSPKCIKVQTCVHKMLEKVWKGDYDTNLIKPLSEALYNPDDTQNIASGPASAKFVAKKILSIAHAQYNLLNPIPEKQR